MNETKFIRELRLSFLDSAAHFQKEPPVIWKLRGSASTAGRPDLIIVDKGKTFFIETKAPPLKRKMNIIELLTTLQKTNLENIIIAGGNAFLVVLFDNKKTRYETKYAIAVILHEVIGPLSKTLPNKIMIELNHNLELHAKENYTTILPDNCFMISKSKGRWYGMECFEKHCR